MPKTGAHLRIEPFGDNVLGVKLSGDKRKPEPDSFRVEFPGGEVDIERCTDGSYWVHVLCNERDKTIDRYGPQSGKDYATMAEARLHMNGKNTSEANMGDFEHPGLYDVAIRIVKEVNHSA